MLAAINWFTFYGQNRSRLSALHDEDLRLLRRMFGLPADEGVEHEAVARAVLRFHALSTASPCSVVWVKQGPTVRAPTCLPS
jgi:hypothetical protein